MKTLGGVGSIPDAYAITLSKPYKWYLVEVERSTHSIFGHIVPQLNKFVQGLKDPKSRRIIVESLYNEIKSDEIIETIVRKRIGSGEIFRFLSATIDKPPILVVIIDEKTKELDDACSSIPITEKIIIEFNIYQRDDASIKNAFLFNPIKGKTIKITKKQEGFFTSQSEYSTPLLASLVELGGQGRVSEVLEKVYGEMKHKLTPKDHELVDSGKDIRWKNQTKWERFNLKQEGFLKSDSPRGLWEISEKGRARLKK